MEENIIEKVDTEFIDVNTTDADSLRSIVMQQRTALENYENKLKQQEESSKAMLDDMNKYYQEHMKQQAGVIKFYERKLALIKDLITLEDVDEEVKENA